VSAEWEGEREWQERVRRIEGLADMTEVFNEAIDEVVIPELKEQFETEGRGTWAPLRPAYAQRKRRLYGDRPILQATGGLARSLTVPGAPHQIREVGPGEAFFGTDLERARFHQRGRGRRRRKILNLTREFRRKVKDFVAKKIHERLRGV
jgi:phage gpG-like protein